MALLQWTSGRWLLLLADFWVYASFDFCTTKTRGEDSYAHKLDPFQWAKKRIQQLQNQAKKMLNKMGVKAKHINMDIKFRNVDQTMEITVKNTSLNQSDPTTSLVDKQCTQVDGCVLEAPKVSITPEVLSKKVCREIMSRLVELYRESHLGNRLPAYDGRKIYTSSKDFVVKLIDKDDPRRRERDFKVAIKFAAKADLHHLQQFLMSRQLDAPQETIQAVDVVVIETPSLNYTVVGWSFFAPELGQIGELGDGLLYWQGFFFIKVYDQPRWAYRLLLKKYSWRM